MTTEDKLIEALRLMEEVVDEIDNNKVTTTSGSTERFYHYADEIDVMATTVMNPL